MNNRLLGLDLLRMLLALAVVVYHYTWSGAAKGVLPDVGPEWFVYLRYAILVFFGVSGFVIARSMAGRGWLRFGVARFVRLYPSLLFCATITAIVWLATDKPLVTTATQYAVAVSFFGIGFGLPRIDASYWTLVYEWQFYAMVAVLLAIGAARSLPWIMTGLSIVGVATLAAGWGAAQYFIPLYMFAPFFALGVCWSLITENGWSRGVLCQVLINLGAAVVMMPETITAFQEGGATSHSLAEAVIITGVVVGLFLAFFYLEIPNRMRGFVGACGAMSYPLYLVHQSLGYRIIRQLETLGVDPVVAICVAILIALGIAWLAVEIAEKRAMPILRAALTAQKLRQWAGRPNPAGPL